MTKIALLIGVSEYGTGLNPLPGSVLDVEAMERVLAHPDMGGFAKADITTLKNPSRDDMDGAIYRLFADRKKDDLLLLYFSGHGIKDAKGRLYLSTCKTRKESNGELFSPSAIAATTLHERINDSRSQRQVIILDCCFSGAIAQGMTVKDDGTVDLQAALGGRGRAILTSSTSLEYSFGSDGSGDNESGLSVYTRYLVEGIETGTADINGDGAISVDELHDYASGRVREVSPAMTPKFYPVEEGYKIIVAKSPKDDPKLKYRKAVKTRAHEGKFSIPARRLLTSLRTQLGLSADVAEEIEAEVLQPYREYQRKLQEYEQTLIEALQDENPLSPRTLADLKDYQAYLALLDTDVAAIEAQLLGQTLKISEPKTDLSLPPLPEPGATYFEFEVVTLDAKGQEKSRRPERAQYVSESLGNDIKLDMVFIPAGKFLMGQTEAEKQELIRMIGEEIYQQLCASELPQHWVTVPEFWMGQYPVTQAQYEAVMGNNPSNFKGANRPVEQVSWEDAIAFCTKLSQQTGNIYRLPSEAEWEYACRAGVTTPFYFGETITTDLANYRGTDLVYEGKTFPGHYGQGPKGIYREQTTDVGSFPPNAFGLYDMHGNVLEWCQDHWQGNYEGAPTDGSAWIDKNAKDDTTRILRGGSWGFIPGFCRSAARYPYNPRNTNDAVGFRVVCSAPRTL